MYQAFKVKKGLDLPLKGGVTGIPEIRDARPAAFAVIPTDFIGMIPKIEISEGDEVLSGQPLIHDKNDEDIKLVSPVAGTIKAIVRGERRRIERIVIEPSEDNRSFINDISSLNTAEGTIKFLKRSGLWAMMRQRPFDIVPNGTSEPRDIFVTAFDSAPLAYDLSKDAAGKPDELGAAVSLLKRLTKGDIYISCRQQHDLPDIDGAEKVIVSGPHPAGNVGIQIANIAPVNKGETVWTLDITTLRRIGHAALTGIVPMDATVAVTGSEIKHPCLVRTSIGVQLSALLDNNINDTDRHRRIISGNVLTGQKETIDGYLHYPYRQVTVIPEGDDVNEFMGWASFSPKKMSQNRSFPGHFLFKKLFNPDARLLGGRRALIMSGEYDRYLPMDIMAEYLLKAIIGRDIEKMEQLGIYEIAPEDFAIGEYADTSKLEAQKIIREGLDYLRKELE